MKMQWPMLNELPRNVRIMIAVMLIPLSIGFYTGISFTKHTTSMTPTGVVENYIGNEENEEAEEMKFKKSARELYNIVHTHLISLGVVFFIIGCLVSMCRMQSWIQMILMVEPFLSLVFTFGGIYIIWLGYEWFSYVVMISGILMTATFTISVLLIYNNLLNKIPSDTR